MSRCRYTLSRARRLLILPVLALGLASGPHAMAQDGPYPSRPIKIVQPTAAGGPSDVLVRLIAEGLQERLGQPVVVENRPGAGGVIGADAAVKAPADGYTILSVGNFHFTTAALREKMPYDAVKDFAGISLISSAPIVMVANKDFPAELARRGDRADQEIAGRTDLYLAEFRRRSVPRRTIADEGNRHQAAARDL